LTPEVSRRGFLLGATAVGVAATVPLDLLLEAAQRAAAAGTRFFSAAEHATCEALCARVVPTDSAPGAREAHAVDFIDLFLAAFELPASAADHPAIWLQGPFSGRNPFGDPRTGEPSTRYPAADFAGADGVHHFLPPTRLQRIAWRARLYGARVITEDMALPAAYRDAVRQGLIPLDPPLRDTYRAGLAAFEALSRSRFGTGVAGASAAQVDALLAAASGSGFAPGGAPASVPPALTTLAPVLVEHTLQACFALPEYGGNRGGAMWPVVGWDGDTQPLGNSIYDASLTDSELGVAQGHNQGFGDPAVFVPSGGYREHRPVSGPDPGAGNPDVERALIQVFGLPS
jgi:hypothetical protein